MPVFGKLLDASGNPRKVVAKRDSKSSDYGRYVAFRNSGIATPIDKSILHNAGEFVALHTQLVDELPAFLEGYMRILDFAVVAFARAQAAYFASIRDKLAAFAVHYIHAPPRRRSSGNMELEDEAVDQSSGRAIIKAWHENWSPFADAMDHFQCTRPGESLLR